MRGPVTVVHHSMGLAWCRIMLPSLPRRALDEAEFLLHSHNDAQLPGVVLLRLLGRQRGVAPAALLLRSAFLPPCDPSASAW